MPRIVVGTGWWCSHAPDSEINPGRKTIGDEQSRAVEFFRTWMGNINQVAGDLDIVVVDSRSPVKPPVELRDQVHWVELPLNAKHSTDHLGQWSGWLRSVMVGGQYALCSDAEYFVYVEQDCLVGGEGVIEHCISRMRHGLMFGSGQGTPQPLQQSFFIVHRDRLAGFLKNLSDLKARDCELAPEWKFVFASWRPFVLAANLGLLKGRRMRRLSLAIAKRVFFDWLPMRGGRSRPLDMTAPFVYFQHGSREEIDAFLSR